MAKRYLFTPVKFYKAESLQAVIQGKALCRCCIHFKLLKPWEIDEWKRLDGEGSALEFMGNPGFCMRHAPQPHQGKKLSKAVWPLVEARQHCGEFLNKNFDKRCEEAKTQAINAQKP
jgi:hypothetical protein